MTKQSTGILSNLNFSTYIQERARDFSGRDWIFEVINDWLNSPDGSRFFIVTGAPGSGKTAIAARLAQFANGQSLAPEELTGLSRGFLSAVHFCWFRELRWLDPRVFSSSVALQLARRYPAYAKALLESSAGRAIRINVSVNVGQAQEVTGLAIGTIDVGGKAATDVFVGLVREPLEKLFQDAFDGQIVILIDAIDEALDYEGKIGIAALIGLAETMPARVRFILTCRPDISLLLQFRRGTASERSLSAGPDLDRCRHDTKQYAFSAVNASNWLTRLPDDLSPVTLATTISEKSNGNFLYVKHVVQMLGASSDKIDLQSVNALPETLDGAYREFLDRLVSRDANIWVSQHSQVLGVLSVAPEQITETQLADFVGADVTQIRRIVKSLRPFLDVDDSVPASKRLYALYHRSFADFLLDRDRAETYWCDSKKYHELIARRYWSVDDSQLRVNNSQLDKYGCRNLSVHLLGAEQFEMLYAIGRDKAFLDRQASQLDDPDAPLGTLRADIQGALAQNNPAAMAEFCLRHAKLLELVRVSNPGPEWGRNNAAAIRLAERQEPDKTILWFLYFIQDRRQLPASIVAECLALITSMEPSLPRLLGWEADLAAELLPSIAELDESLLIRLATRLLHEEELCELIRNVARTHLALSLELAKGISHERWRAAALKSIIDVAVHSSNLKGIERTKLLDGAATLARRFSAIGTKSTSFIVVAQAFAPSDRKKAKSILLESETLARQVQDTVEQANILIAVARAFVPFDRKRSKSILLESEKLVGHIEDKTEQAEALIATAEALAGCGFSGAEAIIDQAVRLVPEINDETPRRASERANMFAQIASQTSAAVVRRVEILSTAGKALARLNPQRAQAVFEEAIAIARAIGESESHDDRGSALREVVSALCRISGEEAWPFLDIAMGLAGEVRSRTWQLYLFEKVVDAIGRERRHDRIDLLRWLLTIARNHQAPELVGHIAGAFARLGLSEANDLLDEALSQINEIQVSERTALIKSILEHVNDLRPDEARMLLDSLSEAVRSIDCGSSQSEMLTSVTIAMHRNHRPDFAFFFCETLVVRDRTASEGERLRALAVLAKRLGNPDLPEAIELADKAVSAARRIIKPSYKCRALAAVANLYYEARRPDASQLVAESLAAALTLKEEDRVGPLTVLAERVVPYDAARAEGFLADAFSCAAKLPNHLPRTDAFVRIAEVAAQFPPNRTKDLIAKVTDAARSLRTEAHRARVLVAVANALSAAGDTSQASQIYFEAWCQAIQIRLLRVLTEVLPSLAVSFLQHYRSELVLLGPKETPSLALLVERTADGGASLMVDSKMASSSETPDVLAGPPHAAQIYYNDIMAACFALVQPATSDPIYDHELAGRVVGMAVRFAKLEPPPRTEVLERLRAVADGLKNEIARSRALAGVAKGYIRCGEFVSALSITEQILTQRAANLAEILRDMVTQKCYGGLSGFVRLSSEYSQTCWLLIEGLVQAHPSDVKLIREGIGRAQEFSGPITTSGVTSAVDKWATLFGPEQENVAVWRANNTKEEMDYLLSFDDKAGEGSEDHQDAQVEGTS